MEFGRDNPSLDLKPPMRVAFPASMREFVPTGHGSPRSHYSVCFGKEKDTNKYLQVLLPLKPSATCLQQYCGAGEHRSDRQGLRKIILGKKNQLQRSREGTLGWELEPNSIELFLHLCYPWRSKRRLSKPNVGTMLSGTRWVFWDYPGQRQELDLDDLCGCFPTQEIL